MLLQLIRLAENSPEQSDRALWDRIDAEPEVARQWRQLQQVRELLDRGEVPHEALTVPTDLLVALLEGALTEERAAEVEAACWQSPAQLAEVISNYRFLNRAPIMSEPSAELSRRIHRLVPPLPLAQPLPPPPPVAAPANRLPRSMAGDSVPISEPANGHRLDHEIVVSQRVRSTRRSSRTVPAWLWPVVASAALLVLLLFAARQLLRVPAPVPGDRNIVGEPPPPVRSPDTDWPRKSPLPDTPLENPGGPLPGNPRSSDDTQLAMNDDADIEPIPEPADSELDSEPLVVEQRPPREFSAPEHSVPFELNWTDIRGLLATRGGEPDRWVGVEGKQSVGTSTTLVTLPGSWSLAELSSGGELTMAPDTEISLAREDGPANRLSLMLRRGKVALRGFPRGQRLRIHSAEHALDAESITEYATIAVSLIADDTVVSVPTGELSAGDERLARHQQLVLGRELPRVVSSASELRDSLEWLEPPATDWTKRKAALARLRKSSDLGADLVKLFDKHDTRQWATVWSLALVPEDSLWRALTHDSRAVRLTALEVLRTIPRRDDRLAALRQSLHRELGGPGAGMFLEWILLARGRTLPKPTVAQSMLEGLTDRRLVVRQTAIYCLDQIYAKPFPRLTPPRYEPEHWSRESVVEWVNYVKTVHELTENRSQRRGPANLQAVPQRQRN